MRASILAILILGGIVLNVPFFVVEHNRAAVG